MRRDRNRWLTAYAVVVYVFLFLPIAILILFSFNVSKRNFAWEGLTLRWYPRLFRNEDLLDALLVTLEVALVAVIVRDGPGHAAGPRADAAAAAGRAAPTRDAAPAADGDPRDRHGHQPAAVLRASCSTARGRSQQISIAHITFCISYVAVVVRARASNLDPQLEEAARDLGASAWGAFRFVTLPLLAAGGRRRRDARRSRCRSTT